MNNKKQHIPAGYKSSPLGIIPENWEVKRLGDLCKKIGSGITPKGGQNVYLSQGHPFMRSQNVANGRLLLDDIVFIDDFTHQKQKSTEIELDDVLLNITGASIGRCAIATQEIAAGNVNQHVCIIRLKDKTLSHYICTFLLSYVGQKQIDSYQAGGNREGLNYNQIAAFKICLPTHGEIIQINNLLSLWDTAISKQTQLVEKLTLRKRGLMQQLLTGKKRLKGFEGEWKEVKLGEIATFFSGGTPKSSNKSYYNGDIPFIRSGEIDKNKTELFISQEGINNSSAKIVEKGDILYALYGATSGQCSMSKIRGAINQAILCIKPNANRYFIMSVLQLNKENYYNSYLQGGQGNLSGEIVSNYIIPIPTNEEQNAIASVLIQADKEIELADEKLTRLQEQKKGLMQVLLSGKKRVK